MAFLKESLMSLMYDWRRDKLATTCLLCLMTGEDSFEVGAQRLEALLPELEHLYRKSRKGTKNRLTLDNDLAKRVYLLADEVLPWIQELAEKECNDNV